MMEAQRLHGHLIGQQGSRRSLNTPALVLEVDMLDRNIAEMASFAKAHNMKLRPQFSKTTKSARHRQMRQIAAGALGVCCAKLGEAEALGEAGVEAMHITSPVVTPQAIARLTELNGKVKDLMVVVDHPANVEALATAAAQAAAADFVIVDIDPGMHRTGGQPRSDGVVELVGRRVTGLKSLQVRRCPVLLRPSPAHQGLQERKASIEERTVYLAGILDKLAAAGLKPGIVYRLRHRHAFHRRQARRLHRAAGRVLRVHGPRLRHSRPARASTGRFLRTGAADRRKWWWSANTPGLVDGRCRPGSRWPPSRARRMILERRRRRLDHALLHGRRASPAVIAPEAGQGAAAGARREQVDPAIAAALRSHGQSLRGLSHREGRYAGRDLAGHRAWKVALKYRT